MQRFQFRLGQNPRKIHSQVETETPAVLKRQSISVLKQKLALPIYCLPELAQYEQVDGYFGRRFVRGMSTTRAGWSSPCCIESGSVYFGFHVTRQHKLVPRGPLCSDWQGVAA